MNEKKKRAPLPPHLYYTEINECVCYGFTHEYRKRRFTPKPENAKDRGEMNENELALVLERHRLWLLREEGGKQADLSGAKLSRADLAGAKLSKINLFWADLRGANLSKADLIQANLLRVDFKGADLRWADLRLADLSGTDLSGADLSGANLSGANLDFSCLPLWCGSKGMKVDRRIAAQLAAHFCALDCDDPDYLQARVSLLEFARTSHRAGDLGLDKDKGDEFDEDGAEMRIMDFGDK